MKWLLIGGFVTAAVLLMLWWVWLVEYRSTDGDD